MAIPMKDDVRLDVSLLQDKFGGDILTVKSEFGSTHVSINRDVLQDVAQFLKTSEELRYTYFVECLGADYSAWTLPRDLTGRFEVIYNLYSIRHQDRLFLKVSVNDGETVPSLKTIYAGAEYPEREIWDLFGIVFEGNEQTERFLLPDDWIGHPLRKEVPLGGDDVIFDQGDRGPAVAKKMPIHPGASFSGRTAGESQI